MTLFKALQLGKLNLYDFGTIFGIQKNQELEDIVSD